MMVDLDKVEALMRLMRKYNINGLKVGEIEIAGLIPEEPKDDYQSITTDKSPTSDIDPEEELLFYSADS